VLATESRISFDRSGLGRASVRTDMLGSRHDDPGRLAGNVAPFMAIGSPVAVLALVMLRCLPAVAAPPAVDMRGDWHGQATGGGPYVNHITSEDCGTGAISGNGGGGSYTWPVSGTLDGHMLTAQEGPYDQLSSYTSHPTGTVSDDGNTFTGTFTDTFGNSGMITWTRLSGPPTDGAGCGGGGPPPAGSSATEVICNLENPDLVNEVFVCTAIVGDARGTSPAQAPTGTVTFVLDPGAGGVLAAPSCTLVPSQTGGSTSFCSLDYTPPAGGIPVGSQPQLTASYGGDATFMPSSARPTSVYSSQTIATISMLFNENADNCLSDASSASTPAASVIEPRLTSPPEVRFAPTDSMTDRAAKVCTFPVRAVGYAAGGVSYLCGGLCDVASNPYVAGTTMAAGGAMVGYSVYAGPASAVSATTGFVTMFAGAAGYYVGAPASRMLKSLGDYIVEDPPDPNYRKLPRAARVKRIRIPKKSPAVLRNLVAFKRAADAFDADATAMITAINRAGGARVAHDTRWESRQTRAALALGGAAREALEQLSTSMDAFNRDWAAYVQTLTPLTAEQIARGREALEGTPKFPAAIRKLLAAFGITLEALRDAAAQANPGDPLATSLQVSPILSGEIAFGKALLVLYPKVPEIQATISRK
jgi:hypothetical protein